MKLKYYGIYDNIMCIVSGILMAVAFTYNRLWFLCLFGMIPFFFVILKRSYRFSGLFLYIISFSLGYYVPLMLWLFNISVLLPFSEKTSKILLFTATVLIGLIQGLYIYFAVFVFVKIRQHTIADIFTFSLLFVLGEFFMENTPLIAFPWGKLGVISVPFTAFIQSASIFGGMFITFLLLVINAGAAFALISLKDRKKLLTSLVTITLIFATNVTFGYIRLNLLEDEKQFKAMVVQGNFSGLDKWSSSTVEMFQRYIDLTKENADENTKLVIWPETAIPTRFKRDGYYETTLITLAREIDATLVVGFFINDGGEKSYNALLAFSPDGTVSDAYFKQILAPFGEYFPMGEFFKKILPMLTEVIDNSSDTLFGESTKCIDTPVGKVGGIICYESIFTKLSLQTVKEGAQIITVASNDSWFDESSALYQHHSHAVMRAVETDRYVLRASNTGVSSIISPKGQVLKTAQPFTQTAASEFISLKNHRTIYCIIGQIFLIPCIITYIYGIIRLFYKHK